MARNKVNIRKKKGVYQEWLEKNGDQDDLHPDAVWEGSAPWAAKHLPLEDKRMEALEEIYPTLKGQQRRIVDLLLEGIVDQVKIADILRIRQQTVDGYLREIGKKITKKSLYIR